MLDYLNCTKHSLEGYGKHARMRARTCHNPSVLQRQLRMTLEIHKPGWSRQPALQLLLPW